jgi:hypothetical protein
MSTDSKCRTCQQHDEKIDHIISACPILAKEEYIKRHDRAYAQLTTLYLMQGNRGKIRKGSCTGISGNKS